MSNLVKFSSQLDEELLNNIKNLAQKEGKQLQSLLNEAVFDLINKYNETSVRENVLEISRKNRTKFNNVFKELAK
jgi:hypothetical protein